MTKPELLVTPGSVSEMKRQIESGADAFVIGEQRSVFALRASLAASKYKKQLHWHMRTGKKYTSQ